MGTGKTTIGRELARAMGRKFVDVDLELEERMGMSVNEIFATEGEAYFRQAEKDLAQELSQTRNKVVATGGGTIINPEVFDLFDQSGLLICLYTKRDDLVNRLQRTDKRPLLSSQNPHGVAEKVDRLMAERRSVYDQVKVRLDTTSLTPLTAARRIHERLKGRTNLLELDLTDPIDL